MPPASRRTVLLACLSLLVLVAPAPAATAQAPLDDQYAVSVGASPTSGSTGSADACVDYTITVADQRPSTALGRPADDNPYTVNIDLSAAPGGWRLGRAPAESIRLGAQESQQLPLSLCPVADAVQPGSVSMTVTVTMQVSNPVVQNPSDSITITAEYVDEGLLGVDLESGWLWLIAAGLAAFLAIVLLTRRRIRHGVTLVCPEAEKRVNPGRGTSFPIRVRNEGGERDVVHLRLDPLPPGWDSFVPVSDLSLDPAEEQTVWLSVRAPHDAAPGEVVTLRTTASSNSAPSERAVLETRTIVVAPWVGTEGGAMERSVLDEEPADDVPLEEGEVPVAGQDAPEEDVVRPVAVRRRKGQAS